MQTGSDIIFLSRNVNIAQETLFRQLREIYPEIKRLHGHYDTPHIHRLINSITESEQALIINVGKFDLRGIGERAVTDLFRGIADNELILFSKHNLKLPVNAEEMTDNKMEVVYLTYQEEIAEDNFALLLRQYPNIKRLHRIKGLTRGFRLASELVTSKWFVLIDGDNQLLPGVDLEHLSPPGQANEVKIFSSRNPVNGLVYGYGGVKICPTENFRKITNDTIDPICSGGMKPVFSKDPAAISITRFNTSKYSAWRAGFRECAMLSAKRDYLNQVTDQWTTKQIAAWKTFGNESHFGAWTIKGAHDGEQFVLTNMHMHTYPLDVINDPDWLKSHFTSLYPFENYD